MARKPIVLVYKSLLLPYSQTFIMEQVKHLSSWDMVLVGERRVKDGLDLGGLKTLLLPYSQSPAFRFVADFKRYFCFINKNHFKLLDREHASLVHVHFGTEAPLIWPLVKRLGLPMVVTLHGADINIQKEYWLKTIKGRLWNYPSRLCRIAKEPGVHFIAVSNAIKDKAVDFGIPAEKISVSYIGVDLNKFSLSQIPIKCRKSIIFIGRLVEKKGCRFLLEAFSTIQEKFSDSELIIVGDGPLEAELKLLAKNLKVNARFAGALPSDRILGLLQEARILCLPSITAQNGDAEGLGMVILEAQACGVPVITSAFGGATEALLHNKTGFAHQEKDIAAIRDALEILLRDDQLAREFSLNGRKFVEDKFDLNKCTRRLEHIYDNCAELV